MNIVSVTQKICFIVETDDEIYPTYQRYERGHWENLMGESWEPCYTDEDTLERMYQEFIKNNPSCGRI